VKIEIDKEKWAGGAEVIRLRQGFRRRNAMAGRVGATIWRDKKQSNFVRAQGRDYKVFRGFSRCRSTGQTHGLRSGAPFSAVMNRNGREKTPPVATGFSVANKRARKQRKSFDRIHPQSRPGLGRFYFACREESFFPVGVRAKLHTVRAKLHSLYMTCLLGLPPLWPSLGEREGQRGGGRAAARGFGSSGRMRGMKKLLN
jgi:hypothetical protein